MKLYKLNQGSTFENLKHFIYLTNEYGVPSAEFVDDFIEQFGKIILNGNFTLTQNQIEQLDELWNDIVKDCINNNVEYKENYNSLFYTVLSTKAVNKIKEDWEQSEWDQLNEQDKLELLEQFIIDFDKHIMDGIDMQDILYFENTPELIKTDEAGNEYIDVKFILKKSISATGKLYRNSSLVVLKGSQLDEIKNSASNTETKLRQTYSQYINDKHLIKDIKCKSPSMAGNLVYGGSSNGFTDWANIRGNQIDIYRRKLHITNESIYNSNKEKSNTKPDYIIRFIKENIHEYMKDKAILEIDGYDGKSAYYNWDYNTGTLKLIPGSEHSTINLEELNKIEEELTILNKDNTIVDDIAEEICGLDSSGNKVNLQNNSIKSNYIKINRNKLNEKALEIMQKESIQHYELRESSYNKIGKMLSYNNDNLGEIISYTDIKVNGKIVDIGEYIHNNKLNTENIKFGKVRFSTLYKEI